MRHYEVMIVLAPDQAEDGFNKQLERFKKIIEDGGGSVVNDDRWGIRSLAYPIKKFDQGFYTVLEWESTPDLLTELDHTLRLEEKVLRHMVIHLDSTALQEQAEMRAKRAEKPGDDKIDVVPVSEPDVKPEAEQKAEPETVDSSESEASDEADPGDPEVIDSSESEASDEADPGDPEAVDSSESEASDEADPGDPEEVDSSESEASDEADPGDPEEVDAEEAEEEEK